MHDSQMDGIWPCSHVTLLIISDVFVDELLDSNA